MGRFWKDEQFFPEDDETRIVDLYDERAMSSTTREKAM